MNRTKTELWKMRQRLNDLEERVIQLSKREIRMSNCFDLLFDYLSLYLCWKPEQETYIIKKKKHVPKGRA